MLFDKIELLAEVLDFKEFIDPAGKSSTDAEEQHWSNSVAASLQIMDR